MSAPATVIPYERQPDPQSSRTCGAACLSMVYRSFGKEIPQAQIWPAIAKPNRFGSLASSTHLMTADALNRGYRALAIQARYPLQVLRLCREGGIRAILNHRLQRDAPTGHYTVLVDLDEKSVVLHDPFLGPSRSLSHAELFELWQPHSVNSEIVGNVLIGIAAEPPPAPGCPFCHTSMPDKIDCPQCTKPVILQPGAILGCVRDGCIARMWNYVCCPSCDYTWSFSLQPMQGEASASASASVPSRPDIPGASLPGSQPAAASQVEGNLDRAFGALDKFCSHILSLPAAANHAEIKQHLESITASKGKLRLKLAEGLANHNVRQDQLATMVQIARQKQEAHRARMEDLARPSPPLDGDALGRAFLKNLGFIN
jgi:hypothetical protein